MEGNKMQATHILGNIPPELQQIFNVGEQVLIKADSSVNGGHFTFMNNKGFRVEADAVEFFGQNVEMSELLKVIPLEITLSREQYIQSIIYFLGEGRIQKDVAERNLGNLDRAKLIEMYYEIKHMYELVKGLVGID